MCYCWQYIIFFGCEKFYYLHDRTEFSVFCHWKLNTKQKSFELSLVFRFWWIFATLPNQIVFWCSIYIWNVVFSPRMTWVSYNDCAVATMINFFILFCELTSYPFTGASFLFLFFLYKPINLYSVDDNGDNCYIYFECDWLMLAWLMLRWRRVLYDRNVKKTTRKALFFYSFCCFLVLLLIMYKLTQDTHLILKWFFPYIMCYTTTMRIDSTVANLSIRVRFSFCLLSSKITRCGVFWFEF